MNERERFGEMVRLRREALKLSQRAAWKAGGPSTPTWTQIENGAGPAPQGRTFTKLDDVLMWRPGSARAAYEDGITPVELKPGHDPKAHPTSPTMRILQAEMAQFARARAQLSRIPTLHLLWELEQRISEMDGVLPRSDWAAHEGGKDE